MPTSKEVLREAVTVLLGAFLAALIIGEIPQARAWMQSRWQGKNCRCEG